MQASQARLLQRGKRPPFLLAQVATSSDIGNSATTSVCSQALFPKKTNPCFAFGYFSKRTKMLCPSRLDITEM